MSTVRASFYHYSRCPASVRAAHTCGASLVSLFSLVPLFYLGHSYPPISFHTFFSRTSSLPPCLRTPLTHNQHTRVRVPQDNAAHDSVHPLGLLHPSSPPPLNAQSPCRNGQARPSRIQIGRCRPQLRMPFTKVHHCFMLDCFSVEWQQVKQASHAASPAPKKGASPTSTASWDVGLAPMLLPRARRAPPRPQVEESS